MAVHTILYNWIKINTKPQTLKYRGGSRANMDIEKYVDERNRFHFNGYNFPELYAWSLGHAGARYDGKFCSQCYIDDMTKKCRHMIAPGNIIEHTTQGFVVIK